MFKKVDRLMWKPMKWYPLSESNRDFVSDSFPKDECYLRMNNFPEEPLWILFYKSDHRDIVDTPNVWKITYRSDK